MDLEIEDDGSLVKKCFPQLDFSSILGFPNDGYDSDVLFDCTPSFHGFDDSTIHHIASFIKIVVDFNSFHDDDLMRVFVCTLKDDALDWY